MYNLRNIRCGKKLAEFSTVCSVTKVVVCYFLNKRMATFTIVPYCQQIAEHSAPVIPQGIRGQILHSVFCKAFSLSGMTEVTTDTTDHNDRHVAVGGIGNY